MSHFETMFLNYKKQLKTIELQKRNKQQFRDKDQICIQKQSIQINQEDQNFQDDNTEQFKVFSQGKNINIPFKTLKPMLINSLLPLKQKMIQQMYKKKQLFQSKIIKNKPLFVQESNFHQKQISQNQLHDIFMQQKSQSQQKQKKKVRLRKKSSFKTSQKETKQVFHNNTEQENSQPKQIQLAYLSKLHEQQSSIMNRLLDIIQKDKEKIMYNSICQSKMISRPSSASRKTSKQNNQKSIIINNYMKPSSENHVDGELLKRQLKIKLLQIQRQQKRTQASSQKVSRIKMSIQNNDNRIESTKERQTQISFIDKKLQTNKNIQHNTQHEEQYKEKPSSVKEFMLQSINQKSFFLDTNREERRQVKNIQINHIRDIKSTNKQLFIDPNVQKIESCAKIQQKIPLTPMNLINQNSQDSQKLSKQMSIGYKNHQILQLSEIQPIHMNQKKSIQQRRPVLFQIPISQNQNVSLSLADAFKKKMKNTKLATQIRQDQKLVRNNNIKTKNQKKLQEKNKQNIPDSQRNHTQTYLTDRMTDDLNQFLPNQTIIQEDTKRTYKATKPKKQLKQMKFDSVNSIQSSVASPRQPSKQLLDRLIYGSKAKIDKKQMYALTKKNYQKLPQVQNKRKLQQKKLKQLQRMQKMKDFQRQIRSSKSSLKS